MLAQLGDRQTPEATTFGLVQYRNISSDFAQEDGFSSKGEDELAFAVDRDMVVLTEREYGGILEFSAADHSHSRQIKYVPHAHTITMARRGGRFYVVADDIKAQGVKSAPSALFVC